jgi:hypothetical protein
MMLPRQPHDVEIHGIDDLGDGIALIADQNGIAPSQVYVVPHPGGVAVLVRNREGLYQNEPEDAP